MEAGPTVVATRLCPAQEADRRAGAVHRPARHVLHGAVPEPCGDFQCKFDRGRPCDGPGKGANRDRSSGLRTCDGSDSFPEERGDAAPE